MLTTSTKKITVVTETRIVDKKIVETRELVRGNDQACIEAFKARTDKLVSRNYELQIQRDGMFHLANRHNWFIQEAVKVMRGSRIHKIIFNSYQEEMALTEVELEAHRRSEAFNREWVGYKNEYARQETLAEQAAYEREMNEEIRLERERCRIEGEMG